MFVTINELAEYLDVSPLYIEQQIKKGNIRTVTDGKQVLVNRENFVKTKEQIERQIELWKEKQLEPIPEDIDVKDED